LNIFISLVCRQISLTHKQRALARKPPAVAGEAAVITHDPVARNRDREGVGGAGARDGAHGSWRADAPSDLGIARRRAWQLAPRLKPGDIGIMDNLSAHKRPDVIVALRAAGAQVLFLPPYSPEYNPIEKASAKLKDILRRLPTLLREAFDHAVAFAMSLISNADIRAWTAFAGYSLRSA
jgi:transposase